MLLFECPRRPPLGAIGLERVLLLSRERDALAQSSRNFFEQIPIAQAHDRSRHDAVVEDVAVELHGCGRVGTFEQSLVARGIHDDHAGIMGLRGGEDRCFWLFHRTIVPAEHGVEVTAEHGLLDLWPIVAGDPDKADQTLCAGAQDGFQSAAGRQRLGAFRFGVQVVELVDVEVVGLQSAQRGFELPARALSIAAAGFAGEDQLMAPALEGLADDLFVFAFAIGARGVDVVDAAVERRPIAVGRFAIAAADAEAGDFEAGAAEGGTRQVVGHGMAFRRALP
jgi:hypothetical protein